MTPDGKLIPDPERTIRLGRLENFAGMAYDLASCGMGVIYHIVQGLNEGRELTTEERIDAVDFGSNMLQSPYATDWFSNQGTMLDLEIIDHPDSAYFRNIYNKVFRPRVISTRCAALRILLDQNNPPRFDHITHDELGRLLQKGIEQGVIASFDESSLRQINPNIIDFDFIYHLAFSGVKFSDNNDLRKRFSQIPFTHFPDFAKATALSKLASMLALTIQLDFDARQNGGTVFDYKPEDRDDVWMRKFGEDVPTVREMYAQAFDVFEKGLNHTQDKDLWGFQYKKFSNFASL